MLSKAWKLAETDKYKKIWLKNYMTEEETARFNVLFNEVKEKNEMRM